MRLRRDRERGNLTAYWLWVGRRFSRRVAHRGFDGVDAVYGFSSASLEMFQAAKDQGIACILDHATAPKRFEDGLTMKQADRYPGWAAAPPQEDRWAEEYAERQLCEAELADIIVCGSTFVRDAIDRESGLGDKCAVVPLGLRRFPAYQEGTRRSENSRLRILFVGDDAIRKGIGDLCTSVRLFGRDRCEVRVAGNLDLSEKGRREAGEVAELLGPVPRADMSNLYRWADVCVLPSVSETFGLVILEAMSHGVPVISSCNTGGADVIRDGTDGFVVPVMAPEAIAERLRQLDSNPGLLDAMATSARDRSREFDLNSYSERLVGVVNSAIDEANRFSTPADATPSGILN